MSFKVNDEKTIGEFCKFLIFKYKKTNFTLAEIKITLILDFNRRGLMWKGDANNWFKIFFEVINQYGFGVFFNGILNLDKTNIIVEDAIKQVQEGVKNGNSEGKT